jgi:hypothetical protein
MTTKRRELVSLLKCADKKHFILSCQKDDGYFSGKHRFMQKNLAGVVLVFVVVATMSSCTSRTDESREEHIRIDSSSFGGVDSLQNSIQGNLSMKQLGSYPNNVILTGLKDHRLVTIYKMNKPERKGASEYSSYSYDEGFVDDRYEHFMPGIDLLFGYNLMNIAHYDLRAEKLNYLFDHPVLVKSLYYPSFTQDSIDMKPINRDYYLVSAYDADTNHDTLINKNDLRRLYYFNASCTDRHALLPQAYSASRSEYDHGNDLMYIFAKFDENGNGTIDKAEPLHVFLIDLKNATQAKRLY